MKLFKGLVKIGIALGLYKTGKKVVDQYHENNPDGVQDVNGDGVVDYKDKTIEAARAADQVFGQFTDKVIEKMSK